MEDVNRLEADEGFCRIWEKARKSGLNAEAEERGKEEMAEGEEAGGSIAFCDISVSGGVS